MKMNIYEICEQFKGEEFTVVNKQGDVIAKEVDYYTINRAYDIDNDNRLIDISELDVEDLFLLDNVLIVAEDKGLATLEKYDFVK